MKPWSVPNAVPPNGYRCRCRAMSMSQAEFDRRKASGSIVTDAPPDDPQTFVNQRTGEVSEVPASVQPGFDYNPGIARAVDGQPDWETLGRPDLRAMAERAEAAPEMLHGAADKAAAVETMRRALAIEPGGSITVETPLEQVRIDDLSLPHVVEKRDDQRERFGGFVLPTLLRPTEVWAVKYDDGSVRNRYIKLFSGSKYDLMVVVLVAPDGSVFWNMMQRGRKGMNGLRIGELAHEGR